MCRLYFNIFGWCGHTGDPHFRPCRDEYRCYRNRQEPDHVRIRGIEGFCPTCWSNPDDSKYHLRIPAIRWEDEPDETHLPVPNEDERKRYQRIMDRFHKTLSGTYPLKEDEFGGLTNIEDFALVKKEYGMMLKVFFWRTETIGPFYTEKERWVIGQMRSVVEGNIINKHESQHPDMIKDYESRLFEQIPVSSLPPDQKACSICTEHFTDSGEGGTEKPCKAPCGHIFGINCAKHWAEEKSNSTCPLYIKAGTASSEKLTSVFASLAGGSYDRFRRLSYIGEEARKRSEITRSRPIQNGLVQNLDDMESLWTHTFSNELKSTQKTTTSSPWTRPKHQEQNEKNGLVVESGEGLTTTSPISERWSMKHTVLQVKIAGEDIDQNPSTLLWQQGIFFKLPTEMNTVRDIKEKLCYVAPKNEHKNFFRNDQYEFPDKRKITVCEEAFQAPEILFQPAKFG
ncbi:hypothetical protein G7Y89_g14243 [Cudoniella acicularis]|uniref:RING-type domain-containing protein n=1 Tax=Cudoniella acicularis TaxID=354080 RepID=A0A8H4VU37_9HELO|nr:hypothetical protein G7Y89_g14243 [Cudoniella acicularis]